MLDFSVWQWVFLYLVVFIASVVRGLAGFGFALVSSVMLTQLLPPKQVIPVIVLCEIISSLGQLPTVWKQINWKLVFKLFAGLIVGTPIGVWFLVNMPSEIMVSIISIIVLIFTCLMLFGFSVKHNNGLAPTLGAGFISGILNGISANAGPPVIIFLLSNTDAKATRASLIAYFLLAFLWSSILYVQQGLLTVGTLGITGMIIPALLIGVWIGNKLFKLFDEAHFKKFVLYLLLVVSTVGILRIIF